MNIELAKKLVETLPLGKPGLFNPWKDSCSFDLPVNDSLAKLERLAYHLDCNPKYILIGEAPGYQGCRYSGIAFTSERLLLEGKIPRIPKLSGRLTRGELSFSEPSATIVWRALHSLGIAENVILWNAIQLHPHKPNEIHTNRTPTQDEINLGEPGLKLLLKTFSDAKIIAVGKKSEGLLNKLGINISTVVRHPANGGASKFETGLSNIL